MVLAKGGHHIRLRVKFEYFYFWNRGKNCFGFIELI